MRAPTKFVATFRVEDGDMEEMTGPNKAKLVDLVKKTIKERAGEDGNGYFEVRKVYTDEDRKRLAVPEGRRGQVDQRTTLTRGKWKMETPFKEYF